ncbi:UNVERIFIED_CONTAM: hypothetical protein PYX00_003849 [Menopon gallinae]|uniref:Fcf2 pre-rRNA processing C-terminal domain-containing protein n=1 Tax=Menopon gallinae TaxID=328185 RepID=A0AAW2I2I4_9NEOP
MLEFIIDKTGSGEGDWQKIDVEDEDKVAPEEGRIVEEEKDKEIDDEDDDDEEEEEEDEEEEECQNLIPLDELPDSPRVSEKKKKSKSDDLFSLDNTYLVTNYNDKKEHKSELTNVDKILEKAVLKPGFEKLGAVPVKKSRRAVHKERKAERDKTKGKDWYNLPATEVTEEIKNDLEVLKMRSALDPKHVYKKNDMKVIPKYFQIGKVVEGAADFYNGRIPKSQRKRTLVDELLADSSFRAYQKKKYKEIVDDNRRKKPKRDAPVRKKSKKEIRDEWLKFD